MKKLLIVLFSIFFICCYRSGKEKIVYHEIEFTASSINLRKQNIENTNGKSYVKEFIDSLGRTKRLEFYNSKGHLDYPGSGYYGGPILKYHYEPKTIVETAYTSDIDLANDFQHSEVPNQIIYHLNQNKEIEETIFRYKVEFNMDKKQISSIIENLELYNELIPESGLENRPLDSVFGYQFAHGKLNGINPKASRIK